MTDTNFANMGNPKKYLKLFIAVALAVTLSTSACKTHKPFKTKGGTRKGCNCGF